MELPHFEDKRPAGAHPVLSGNKKLRPKEGDELADLEPRSPASPAAIFSVSVHTLEQWYSILSRHQNHGGLVTNTPRAAPP